MDNTNIDEIIKGSLRNIRAAINAAKLFAQFLPEDVFCPEEFSTPIGPKKLLRIDQSIELMFKEYFIHYKRGKFFKQMDMRGEESFFNPDLDFTGNSKIVVIMDMIDGTDLFVRKLYNWCSAVVFFEPKSKKILATLVGLPYKPPKIYGWYPNFKPNPFWAKLTSTSKYDGGLTFESLRGPNKQIKSIKEASICFYGQKAANFSSPFEYEIMDKIKKDGGKFRIYNFGGNPMMIRLAEGDIDAIVELVGQPPHDVVAGAYIAKQVGAIFRDLEGNDIDDEKLGEVLLKPAKEESKIKYILASTEELYWDIQKSLSRLVNK